MRNQGLWVLVFTIFLDFVGCFMVLPIFAPMLLNSHSLLLDSGASHFYRTLLIGLLIMIYGLGQLFGGPYLGGLSDQIGRKKTLLGGLIILIAGNLLGVASLVLNNLFLLFACRFLTGVASGNASVIFAAVSTMSADNKERGINMGYLAGAVSVGCVLGPILGSSLTNPDYISWFTWYVPFLAMAFLIFVNALLVWIFFVDAATYQYHRLSIIAGFRNIFDCIANPKLRILLYAYFFMIMSTESIFAGLPIFAVDKFNLSSVTLGKLLAWGSLLAAFSSFCLNRLLCKKLNSYQITFGSASLLCVGYLIFMGVSNAYELYLPYSLVGLMCSLQYAHANALIADNTDPAVQGKVLGVTQALLSLAIMIGPTLIGLVAALNPNYIMIFCFLSGFFGLMELIAFRKRY